MIKTNCNLLVIFGATGDLARRKLFPALNDIISSKKLPTNTYLLGCGRKEIDNDVFNGLEFILHCGSPEFCTAESLSRSPQN